MTFPRTDTANPVPNLESIAKEIGGKLTTGGELVPSGVAIGSQYVEPGFVFIAPQGANHHGLDFLDEALSRGAIALITDRHGDYPIPAIFHSDPRAIAGLVAASVFDSGKVQLFGITGTNGKTSTAIYLQRLLTLLGENAGLVTSHQQLVGTEEFASELTTPEAPKLHQLLHKMHHAGQSQAVIEVSAQAQTRKRIDGLHFSLSGFTNLSRDHLDDYSDMESYLAAKKQLFTSTLSDRAVIVCEDNWGKKLFDRVDIPKVGIGEDLDYQLSVSEVGFSLSGAAEVSMGRDISGPMAKNLALSAVMALEAGHAPEKVTDALRQIQLEVPGRLEAVTSAGNVYVDYAHTPAGVEASVRHLLEKHGELVVVLGASGNRDKGKRSEMAEACRGVTKLFVTDQHPRNEEPAAIRQTLLRAAEGAGIATEEVADPAQAFRSAFDFADGGAVLWCGPGALTYREIAGRKEPFDARKIAREVAGE